MRMAYQFDKFKHLQNSRIQQIVPAIVSNESINYRGKKIALCDVTIVKFIFQGNNLSHKSQWTKHQESVSWFHEDKNFSK